MILHCHHLEQFPMRQVGDLVRRQVQFPKRQVNDLVELRVQSPTRQTNDLVERLLQFPTRVGIEEQIPILSARRLAFLTERLSLLVQSDPDSLPCQHHAQNAADYVDPEEDSWRTVRTSSVLAGPVSAGLSPELVPLGAGHLPVPNECPSAASMSEPSAVSTNEPMAESTKDLATASSDEPAASVLEPVAASMDELAASVLEPVAASNDELAVASTKDPAAPMVDPARSSKLVARLVELHFQPIACSWPMRFQRADPRLGCRLSGEYLVP